MRACEKNNGYIEQQTCKYVYVLSRLDQKRIVPLNLCCSREIVMG